MSENNSRAYCFTHKYFEGKKWRTPQEADNDMKDHLRDYPGDNVEIELKQTTTDLRESLMNQKFFFKSTLNLLSDSNISQPEEVGACKIELPIGESKCIMLTKKQCEILGGDYIGGECM